MNWITELFDGKGNEKKASIPEERQIDSDTWAAGLVEDADHLEKLSAASAGTIFQQFVDDLGDEKRTARNLSHLEHALSYAPGMDMIDPDHWTQLMDIAKNQDIFRFKEIVQDFAKQYADQKGISYEKYMKDKYPVDAKNASKKKAAYEKGDTCDKTIEKDYKLRVSGLSDYNLAEMIAERVQCAKGTATVNFNEEKEKQLKSVKNSREAAEKKLLGLIGEHTKTDWKKAFQKFEDAKPIEAKEEDLYADAPDKKKWTKKETFEEKTDKEKIKDMEGVGKEEAKGQVGKEASKKKAAESATNDMDLLAVYTVYKSVTTFNEESQDWSGKSYDIGEVSKENVEVNSVKDVLAKAQNDLGLVYPFEAVQDEPGRYDTNQAENGEGYHDENGKYLADYSLYIKLYKEASKTLKLKKKASEVTDKIKKKVEKKINEIVDQALEDSPGQNLDRVPSQPGMGYDDAIDQVVPKSEDIPIVDIEESSIPKSSANRDKDIIDRDVELEQAAVDEYSGQKENSSPELKKVLDHVIDQEKEHKKEFEDVKKKSNKMSDKAQEWVSKKIKFLVDEEGKSQDQAIAMAYSMAKDKGYDIPEKKASKEAAQHGWDVFLNGKKIDTVFYDDSYKDAEEVKRSLVDHDSYDPNIKVRRDKYGSKKKADILDDTVNRIKDNIETTKERLDVQTKESDYQGWKNYETWAVALWFDNEQTLQEDVKALVGRSKDVGEASQALKDFVEELTPDLGATVFADLLTGAIDNVDWYEIASHYKEPDESGNYPQGGEPTATPPSTPPTASRKSKFVKRSRLVDYKERLDVQTKESDYQGWKNYETWAVALWLDNDQGTYDMVRQIARESTGTELAQRLKEYVEENQPDLGLSMYADILSAALSEVDWYEIANNLHEDLNVADDETTKVSTVEKPSVTSPDAPSGTTPTASKKQTKEIKSKLSKKEIIAKMKRNADITSPWKVIKNEKGEEIIALVSPLKREKLSKDKKIQDKKI